jgi:hypothetical protein
MLPLAERVKKEILKNKSFALIQDKIVYFWLNEHDRKFIDKSKLFKMAKALTVTNTVSGLDFVYIEYKPNKEYGMTVHRKTSSSIFINLFYGKTIKGLTYTCLHEYCHSITEGAAHSKRWRNELSKFYPDFKIKKGEVENIPWPSNITEAPKIRKYVVLNEY